MPQPGIFAFIQSEFIIGIIRFPWYFANFTSKNFIWRWMIWAVVVRLNTGVVGANPGFRPSAPVQECNKLIPISHPPEAVRGIHNSDFFTKALDLISATHPFNCATGSDAGSLRTMSQPRYTNRQVEFQSNSQLCPWKASAILGFRIPSFFHTSANPRNHSVQPSRPGEGKILFLASCSVQ